MEGTSSTAIAEPYREGRHIKLMPGSRELAAIVAFWVGYALLTLANRIFDQGGPSAAINGRIAVAAIEALCWMVLTPVLFALVGRVDLESSRSRRDRWQGLLLIALVTVASAALLGTDRPRASRGVHAISRTRRTRRGPWRPARGRAPLVRVLQRARPRARRRRHRAWRARTRFASARAATRRSSSRASSPRRASTRCAASSIRTSCSTPSTRSPPSSSAIRVACAA